jgi:hypothetical protein
MTQLTNTRSAVVFTAQAMGSLIVLGLIVAGLVGASIILRPTAAAPAAAKPVVQVPARDDYALRQPTTATGADDYGLRHSTPAIVATTSRMDDYSFRHPSSAAGASQSEDRSDFGLRHPVWIISESR